MSVWSRLFCIHHYHDTGKKRRVNSYCACLEAHTRLWRCCKCGKERWDDINPNIWGWPEV